MGSGRVLVGSGEVLVKNKTDNDVPYTTQDFLGHLGSSLFEHFGIP